MELIDVHSHLNAKLFDKDRKTILQEARNAGITAVFDAGENIKENDQAIQLAVTHPLLKPCAGFNPRNLKNPDVKLVQDHIRSQTDKIYAIGEVGLDYWHVKTAQDRIKQKEIFISFIELAKELDKPLVIHSRSAGKYATDLLKKHNAQRVCMHAFDGSAKNAKFGVEAGYFFSIPPSIIRSEQKKKLVEIVPLENLLLESDAPALGPERGVRNEPKNIKVARDEIARIKGITKQEVAQITTENAKKLFGI